MPPAVRWSVRSVGWLWIFGAALGQCLGYSSQQQRVVLPPSPGQYQLQASYLELKPNQVTALLRFALGGGGFPAPWDFKAGWWVRSGWAGGGADGFTIRWLAVFITALQCLTDRSPGLLTTNRINISPPGNAEAARVWMPVGCSCLGNFVPFLDEPKP